MKFKTALVFGGGGSRGAYEIGVWQALNELGIEINIVTGASIGAVNGAMFVQGNIEDAIALWHSLKESTLSEIDDQCVLKDLLQENLQEQVVRDSTIEYGMVTVELPTLVTHHKFIEDIPVGKLNDYILASAACYPIMDPHKIGEKKFIDGGYLDILPVKMALDKGAEEVIAVNLDAFGYIDKKSFKEVPFLKVISSSWDLGAFTTFNPENIRHNIRLGYLDTMKVYGVLAGDKYSFIRGSFARQGLREADAAAEIFELDPYLIYSKTVLDQRLMKAINVYQGTINKVTFSLDLEAFKKALNKLDAFLSNKTLVLYIAQKLHSNEIQDSSTGFGKNFLTKKAANFFEKELLAAHYIYHLSKSRS